MAEAAAQQGNKTMAQHFKAMANAKHTKNSFQLWKNVIKPQDRSGITRLKVPTTNKNGTRLLNNSSNEQWHVLTDPQDIEKTIIKKNIQHFGQAHDTPFNTKEFTDMFGIDGDSEVTEALLQGTLPNISRFPLEVQLILKKYKPESPPNHQYHGNKRRPEEPV